MSKSPETVTVDKKGPGDDAGERNGANGYAHGDYEPSDRLKSSREIAADEQVLTPPVRLFSPVLLCIHRLRPRSPSSEWLASSQ